MKYSLRYMVRKRQSTVFSYLPGFATLEEAIARRDKDLDMFRATNPGTVILVCNAATGNGISCVGQEQYEHLYKR